MQKMKTSPATLKDPRKIVDLPPAVASIDHRSVSTAHLLRLMLLLEPLNGSAPLRLEPASCVTYMCQCSQAGRLG